MDPARLIAKYRPSGVLLDTNLLVLLVIGLYSQDRISTFKRTVQYTRDDFHLVAGIATTFSRRITTPQILAEVDNLTRQLPGREHAALAAIMSPLIEEQFEIYSPSAVAAHHERYVELGLTDCTTIAAADGVLVITDDFRLSNILGHLGRDAVNLNHLRPFAWS